MFDLLQEVVKPSRRFLLCDTKNGGFRVTCSRAVLNCLLQRAEFKKNVELSMQPIELEHTFSSLQFHTHFKLDEMDQWLDSNKGKLLSSILAISKSLSSLGVSLSPVDDITYTSLVERPCGYICCVEEGWVVLRAVSGEWYLLDPRSVNVTPLSDTHLHMIIKQLLLENEPIFRVSGGELSTVNPTQAGSEDSADTTCCDHASANPEPPDPQQERRDEVVRVLSDLSRLHMSPQRRPTMRSENQERSRSVTRHQFLWRSVSQRRRPIIESRSVFDLEWPPLDQDTRPSRRRRARSSPRSSQPLEQQQYHPPRETGGAGKGVEKPSSQGGRKSRQVIDGSVCCICLESYPDHVLYPCGHQCLCIQCKNGFIAKFKQCPICKKNVTDVIKIFRA